MSSRIHEYRGKEIIVRWDSKRCIHVAECIRGLKIVFDTTRTPWVQPDNADAERVAEIVQRCPTGALHFEPKESLGDERIPNENSVEIAKDGPLYLRGDIEIIGPDSSVILRDTRVALCRCGASGNKPFCDGKHRLTGFKHDLPFIDTDLIEESQAGTSGRLTIRPLTGGPLSLEGNFRIRRSGNDEGYCTKDGDFCRCGQSNTKPFCDGSHEKIHSRNES